MIRGTTPTFRLTIKDETVDLTDAVNVYATFKQPGCGISLTKTGTDVTVEERTVNIYLAQKETLLFKEGPLDIQLNWVYEDGKRACSNIVTIEVGENLIGKVLK